MLIAEIITPIYEYDAKKIQGLESLLAKRSPDPFRPKTDNVIELANDIEKMGVTNGEQIFWLLHRYLKRTEDGYGINRWEDIKSRAIPALIRFDELKRKPQLTPALPTKDLNQIPGLKALDDIIDRYKDTQLVSKKDKNRELEKNFFDSKQAQIIYNDNDIKIVRPLSHAASCYFGRNTKWCTTSKNNPEIFDDYARGPLYIILIKKLNKRYQFSLWMDQYMDGRDDPIDPRELADQYPVLWKIFTPLAIKYKSLWLNPHPSDDQISAAIQYRPKALKGLRNPSEKHQLEAVKKDPNEFWSIANPSERTALYIAQTDPDVLVNLPFDEGPSDRTLDSYSDAVQLAAIEKDPDMIAELDDPSEELQMAVVRSFSQFAMKKVKNPTQRVQQAMETIHSRLTKLTNQMAEEWQNMQQGNTTNTHTGKELNDWLKQKYTRGNVASEDGKDTVAGIVKFIRDVKYSIGQQLKPELKEQILAGLD
jgi:hypothetical protein